MSTRRIIGIDPGLASTGWGLIEVDGNRLVYRDHGCIETGAETPRPQRLLFIYESINEVLDTCTPSEGAIETLYFGRNVTSAMSVAEARGILTLALAGRGIPVHEYTPNAIKLTVVGINAAGKKQVQEMVRLLLGLKEIPRPDHAADALGAAICAANTGLSALGL
jgi:crossover junction endodeoxyribonuclease RuvC